MRHIRTAVAGLAVLLGGAAVAAAQGAPPVTQRGQARAHQRGPQGGPGGHLEKALFQGIQLSDAEKARIKTIRQQHAQDLKSQRGGLKPDAQAIRDARQRGDTAALRAERQKMAPQREQMQKLAQQLRGEYRTALTPENRAKFDANVAKLESRVAQRGQDGGPRGRRPGRIGKGHSMGPRV